MAVVSRISTIKFDNTLGSSKTWVGAAAVENTAAGSSVVVTVTRTDVGVAPPGDPDAFTLGYYTDDNTLIQSVLLITTAASQTDTFFFTDTGFTGGATRCGTVEIRLRATKTSGGPAATYDTETDGSPNTPPTTFTTTQLDRGWIRGTTTLTQVVSNVSVGGAKTEPAQYDESLFVRTTAGAVSYVARTVTVASSVGSLSSATNSTATTIRDASFAAVVDSRFAAASTVVSWTVTPSNAALTGLPFTVFTTVTADTITVDPRLTVTHLLQVDDNNIGTPPLAKNSLTGQRLTTQIGYTDTNFRAARGTRVGNAITQGVNGLGFSVSLQDAAGATTPLTRTATTSTQGGETGWGAGFLQWTSQLPGGAWTKTVTLNASVTDLTNAYLLNPTVSYTLLAVDPNFIVIVGGGPAGGEDNHLSPGSTLLIGMVMMDTSNSKLLTPDATPAPAVVVARFNQSLGRPEYLKADLSWASLGGGATAYPHPLTASAGDPWTFVKTFSMPVTTWTTADLFLIGVAYIGGTPYNRASFTPVLSPAANPHSANQLDAVGLALSGNLGFK